MSRSALPEKLQIGGWSVHHDPAKTRLLNDAAAAEYSAADRLNCDCVRCRNFRAVPGGGYPKAFLSLLESLGLAPGDEAELTEHGVMGDGRHLYSGEFELVGRVEAPSDPVALELDGLEVSFSPLPQPIPDGPLAGEPHALLGFGCRRPWVLDEPYPPPGLQPPTDG